jgi:integrase
MSIYKRGNVYWYDFVFNGERHQRSTKQGNQRVAQQIEAAERTRLAKGEVGIKDRKPIPTFAEYAKVFRAKMQIDHAAKPKTAAHYSNGMNRLLEFDQVRNAKLDEISRQVIDDYIAHRSKATIGRKKKPIKVASINRELEALRRLLNVAVENGIITSHPKITRLKGEQGRDRVLDHAEEQAYLMAAKQPLRDVATIIVDTGMRPEEVFRMCWEHVHFEPAGNARFGRIFNPFGKTENAKRNVSMTQRVRALLEMRHEQQGRSTEGWLFPAPTKIGRLESMKSQHAKALKDSKVKPFVLYSLRHTMLTRLGEAGADAFAIQKIAGHSSIVVSQRYVHPTPERLESAFAALEAYNAAKQEKLNASRKVQ